MCRSCQDAANQIEEEESKVSQRVLDVVSKYPKIEHITAYMK